MVKNQPLTMGPLIKHPSVKLYQIVCPLTIKTQANPGFSLS